MTMKIIDSAMVLLIGAFIFLCIVGMIERDMRVGCASWYSEAEYPEGIMANGEELDDDKLTCASWDYDFETQVRVTNEANGKSVLVRVTDRGPSKRLYRMGRIIDLSKRAFSEIAPLEQGLVEVRVKCVNGS